MMLQAISKLSMRHHPKVTRYTTGELLALNLDSIMNGDFNGDLQELPKTCIRFRFKDTGRTDL